MLHPRLLRTPSPRREALGQPRGGQPASEGHLRPPPTESPFDAGWGEVSFLQTGRREMSGQNFLGPQCRRLHKPSGARTAPRPPPESTAGASASR